MSIVEPSFVQSSCFRRVLFLASYLLYLECRLNALLLRNRRQPGLVTDVHIHPTRPGAWRSAGAILGLTLGFGGSFESLLADLAGAVLRSLIWGTDLRGAAQRPWNKLPGAKQYVEI